MTITTSSPATPARSRPDSFSASDEKYEEAARKMEEKMTAAIKAKEAEEEKTHIQTRIGARVGVDRGFPEGRYTVHKLLGKGMCVGVLVCVCLCG